MKHTKDSIVEVLQDLAKRHNATLLSTREIETVLPISSIRYHWASVSNALEAAGLDRIDSKVIPRVEKCILSDCNLFQSLLDFEREHGHEPGYSEYNAFGRYSTKPFNDRFGRWAVVLVHYREWRDSR